MKIIDITAGNITPKEVQELREATAKEIDILRKVSGHPNVSELGSGSWGEGFSAPFILQGVPSKGLGMKSPEIKPPRVSWS